MQRRDFLKQGTVVGTAIGGLATLSGCIGGSSAPEEATFRVNYLGDWSGSVGTGGSSKSISGFGRESYTITNPSIVSGNAQKRDNGSGRLTVSVLVNGDIKARTSTSAEYGLAQVSHTF